VIQFSRPRKCTARAVQGCEGLNLADDVWRVGCRGTNARNTSNTTVAALPVNACKPDILEWRSRFPTTRGLAPDLACRLLRPSQTSALGCQNPRLFTYACWASDEPRAPTPRQLQHSSRLVSPSAHNVRPVRRLGPSVTPTTDHGASVRTDRMDGSTSSASAEGRTCAVTITGSSFEMRVRRH
jgi:hypothetical protein